MRDPKNLQGNKVILKQGDSFEKALRKFKKKIQESGMLQELREREYYEKPTTLRKRKKAAAVNRWKKHLEKQKLPPKHF